MTCGVMSVKSKLSELGTFMPVYGRDGYMQRAVVIQYISVVSCVGEMVICGGLGVISICG